MNRRILEKVFYLFLILTLGFLVSRCATRKEELHEHGDTAPMKTYPKDYVHPLAEINLEKVIDENRGLRVLEENATKLHDYYRGSVQEKAEGERLLRGGNRKEALIHFEKSNWFLRVVLKYLPEDEAYRNIYGDHAVIFLPNLLMADNYLRLTTLYKETGQDEEAEKAMQYGKDYLSFSLKNVKTEWAYRLKKEFEQRLPKK